MMENRILIRHALRDQSALCIKQPNPALWRIGKETYQSTVVIDNSAIHLAIVSISDAVPWSNFTVRPITHESQYRPTCHGSSSDENHNHRCFTCRGFDPHGHEARDVDCERKYGPAVLPPETNHTPAVHEPKYGACNRNTVERARNR